MKTFYFATNFEISKKGGTSKHSKFTFYLSTIMIDFFTLDSLTFPAYALKTRFGLLIMFSEIKRVKWSQKGQTWTILTFLYQVQFVCIFVLNSSEP